MWFEPKLSKEFKCNQMNLDQFWFFKQEGMIAHLILVEKSKTKTKSLHAA